MYMPSRRRTFTAPANCGYRRRCPGTRRGLEHGAGHAPSGSERGPAVIGVPASASRDAAWRRGRTRPPATRDPRGQGPAVGSRSSAASSALRPRSARAGPGRLCRRRSRRPCRRTRRPAAAPAPVAPAPALPLASVAFTCCSVMTLGGFDVMIVAVDCRSLGSPRYGRLAVSHDLHTALVDVPLREHLQCRSVRTRMLEPDVLHHGPVLHFRDGHRSDGGLGRDGRCARHARLQLAHRELLSVDVEAEVIGHRQFPCAFGQSSPRAGSHPPR